MIKKLKFLVTILGVITLVAILLREDPVSHERLIKNTVMVKGIMSGGTGVVLLSTHDESLVLTNKHVCGIIASGSGEVINYENQSFSIYTYKESRVHDLCMISVIGDLKSKGLVVSSRPPRVQDEVHVSGHPFLLPTTVTSGVITGNYRSTVAGTEYNMTAISALIAPGSSGSMVVNDKGEIVALVFAGAGGVSFGLTVPWIYLRFFIDKELVTLPALVPHEKSLLEQLEDILKGKQKDGKDDAEGAKSYV